ncbi:hypothetical protein [Nocardia sp. X0981]
MSFNADVLSIAQPIGYSPVSGAAPPLPAPAELFRAISGRFIGTVPLVTWARELSDLHAGLVRFREAATTMPPQFDGEQVRARIDCVIAEIDLWAVHNVPRARGARKNTHSLGDVISHIARSYAEAWWTVLHSTDAEMRHHAWVHLGEAREGYAEMVAGIQARTLQLPRGSLR